MKTRLLLPIFLLTALACNAQIKKLQVSVKDVNLIPIDKKSFYAFDNVHFYRFEDTAHLYMTEQYKCDTIDWPQGFLVNRNPYEYTPDASVCQFKDPQNGIVAGTSTLHHDSVAVYKTTDGGYHWQLLHLLPDSLGTFKKQVAIKDFDSYLLATNKGVYHVFNGNLSKLAVDPNTGSCSVIYQNGYYAVTSEFSNIVYTSTDGLDWSQYTLTVNNPNLGFHFKSFSVVASKLYMHHETGVYIPNTKGYLSIIDLENRQRTMDTIPMWLNMLVDRKGNAFFLHSYYQPDPTPIFKHTMYLRTKDTTLIPTSYFTGSTKDPKKFFRGLTTSFIQPEEGTLYLFDNTDCDQIDMTVTENTTSFNIHAVAKDITAINYPGAVTIDPHTKDTISTHCCWYQLPKNYESDFEGQKIKYPSSDRLIVLLNAGFRKEAYCVLPTTFSVVTSLKDNQEVTRLNVHPNPATDFISIADLPVATTLTVRDEVGRLVLEEVSSTSNEKLEIGTLPSGYYSIIATFKEGKTRKSSFIKQ